MNLQMYFLIYIIYAFFGWILECLYAFIKSKKFVNRGFLIGPWIPIYGYGALLITLLLKKYIDDPFALFAMSLIVCSILEYVTSYVLEKIFKVRWWDYSSNKYNINGRVCLETMIPFGIMGMIVMYIINPLIMDMINNLSYFSLNFITILIFIFFLIDNVISFKLAGELKNMRFKVNSDNTEEINKKIRKKLEKHYAVLRVLYLRIVNAFPKLKWKKNHK